MLFSMRKIGCPGFIKKTSLRETEIKCSLSLCGSEFHSWVEKLKSDDLKQSVDAKGLQ